MKSLEHKEVLLVNFIDEADACSQGQHCGMELVREDIAIELKSKFTRNFTFVRENCRANGFAREIQPIVKHAEKSYWATKNKPVLFIDSFAYFKDYIDDHQRQILSKTAICMSMAELYREYYAYLSKTKYTFDDNAEWTPSWTSEKLSETL